MSLESCLCHSWAVHLDLVRVAAGTHIHLQGTGASAGSQPAQRTGRGFLTHRRWARRVVPPPLEIIWWPLKHKQISLVAQTVKCLPTMLETRDRSLGREDLWRRKWQPTPVLLPGKSHGQRNLVGYSPWGCKELDMTERLSFPFLFQTQATI